MVNPSHGTSPSAPVSLCNTSPASPPGPCTQDTVSHGVLRDGSPSTSSQSTAALAPALAPGQAAQPTRSRPLEGSGPDAAPADTHTAATALCVLAAVPPVLDDVCTWSPMAAQSPVAARPKASVGGRVVSAPSPTPALPHAPYAHDAVSMLCAGSPLAALSPQAVAHRPLGLMEPGPAHPPGPVPVAGEAGSGVTGMGVGNNGMTHAPYAHDAVSMLCEGSPMAAQSPVGHKPPGQIPCAVGEVASGSRGTQAATTAPSGSSAGVAGPVGRIHLDPLALPPADARRRAHLPPLSVEGSGAECSTPAPLSMQHTPLTSGGDTAVLSVVEALSGPIIAESPRP
jgi:hypothetical protein